MAQNPFDQFGYAPGVSDVPEQKQAETQRQNVREDTSLQLQIEAARRAAAAEARANEAAQREAVKFQQDQAQGGGAKPTEAQQKTLTLLTRIAGGANDIQRILSTAPTAQQGGIGETLSRNIFGEGLLTRQVAGPERRIVTDAQLDVLDALLTLGTGAAYTKEQLEAQSLGYFPQYGDTPSEIAVKNQRLQRVIEAARIQVGPLAAKFDESIKPMFGGTLPTPAPTQGGGTEPVGFRLAPEQEKAIADYVKSPQFTPWGYVQLASEAAKEAGANVDEQFMAGLQSEAQSLAGMKPEERPTQFSYAGTEELTRRQLDEQIAQQNEAVRGGLPDISLPGLVQRAGLGGTMGLSDEIAYLTALASGGNPQVAAAAEKRRMELMREQQGVPGYIAEGIGGIVPASGFIRGAQALRAGGAAPILGETAFGAAYGGAEAQEGQRGRGALLGAVTAPAAYGASAAAGKGLGFIAGGINPAYIPGVRRLQAQGVEPTTGQILREYGRPTKPGGINGDIGGAPGIRGSMARRVAGFEDRLAGLPITGGAIGARRTEAEIASNLAAGRAAVEPLGAQSRITTTGEDMVAQMENPIDAAYKTIGGMRIGIDPPLKASVRRIQNQINRLPTFERDRLNSVLNDVVLQRFGQTQTLTGGQLKDINNVFVTERQNIMRNPQGNVIDPKRAARVLDRLEDSLFNAARRQDPQNFRLWRDASEAFKRSKIVEGAVEGSTARPGMPGVFPQSGLATQVRMASRKYGKTPIGELSKDITTVLPSQQRDPGTAGQLLTGMMLGGGGGAAAGGPVGAALGAFGLPTVLGALSLPATRTGQRMINPLLQGTASGQQALSRGLTDAAPFIGMGGSSVAVPQTTPQLTPEQEAEEQRKLLEAMKLGQTYIRMPVASNPYAVR